MKPTSPPDESRKPAKSKKIERIQTGVRMEKSLVKVLKGIAEYADISLGDLLEGIVLHSFEGKAPFESEQRQKMIKKLKDVYNCTLTAADSHKLEERDAS